MSAFPLAVELLQPAQDTAGRALDPHLHPCSGRWLARPPGSRSQVDGAEAQVRSRVLEILFPPAGVGSRWLLRLEDVSWAIEDADYPIGTRVLRLTVSATRQRGLIAITHPSSGFDSGFGLGFGAPEA